MITTLYGCRVAWCADADVHDEHSRFNKITGETTICPGTDPEEAREWERERAISQSDE